MQIVTIVKHLQEITKTENMSAIVPIVSAMFIQFVEMLEKTVFKHLKLFLVEFQSCFCLAQTLASLIPSSLPSFLLNQDGLTMKKAKAQHGLALTQRVLDSLQEQRAVWQLQTLWAN